MSKRTRGVNAKKDRARSFILGRRPDLPPMTRRRQNIYDAPSPLLLQDTVESTHVFMNEALAEAKNSLSESGIPFGPLLVIDDKIVVGAATIMAFNRVVPFCMRKMDCIENGGSLKAGT